jgi:nonsense-mediated mRNA decay protein 3
MPHRFCAICGKPLNDKVPHYNMCMNCYLNENPLFELPDSFSIKICNECGKYSKKEEWIECQYDDIYSIIEEAVKKFLLKNYLKANLFEFTFTYDERNLIFSSNGRVKSLTLNVDGRLLENPKLVYEQRVNININYELCKNCSNLKSGIYFLSIIQLRVKSESFFDIIADALSKIQNYVENLFFEDNRQYISKLEDQKYGVDLYLSTNELMNKIISFLKPNYHFLLKRSKKLVGRDSQKGRNIYRLKTLVKFLPFKKSDWILLNEEKYFIENITKKMVILRDEHNLKIVKNYNHFFEEKLSLYILRDEV